MLLTGMRTVGKQKETILQVHLLYHLTLGCTYFFVRENKAGKTLQRNIDIFVLLRLRQ